MVHRVIDLTRPEDLDGENLSHNSFSTFYQTLLIRITYCVLVFVACTFYFCKTEIHAKANAKIKKKREKKEKIETADL